MIDTLLAITTYNQLEYTKLLLDYQALESRYELLQKLDMQKMKILRRIKLIRE